MEVVGYAYDAAIHCPDCTEDYVRDIPVSEYNVENWHNHDMTWEELVDEEVVTDSENNPIHPVFDTDETDCPDHCDDCRAFIDTSWTGEAVNYATQRFVHFVEEWMQLREGGDPVVLATWADNMSGMFLDEADERAVYLFKVVLDEMEPNV